MPAYPRARFTARASVQKCALVASVTCLLAFLIASPAVAAMKILGLETGATTPDRYDRFDNSTSYIGNPYNWLGGAPAGTNPYPWNGVGRSLDGHWGTMISPSYIISANHYPPNGTVRFYYTNNPNGPYEDRTILYSQAVASVPNPPVTPSGGDIWIGRLDAPVSSYVQTYPILNLPQLSDYMTSSGGLGITTFGLSDTPAGADATTMVRMGRNVINPSSAYASSAQVLTDVATPGSQTFTNSGMGVYAYQFNYDNPGIGPDESMLVAGDSGGPSFFLYGGGSPALVGIHWYANSTAMPPYSGDSLVQGYLTNIQYTMNYLADLNGLPRENLKTESPVLGDLNLDGHVNGADVVVMMSALSNPQSYQTLHGMNSTYFKYIADMNGDGKITNADLQALITDLRTGHGSEEGVPEPASLGLMCFALAVLTLSGRRRLMCGVK